MSHAPTFDKVGKNIILVNLLVKTWRHWRNEPLWSVFADVCGVGSTSAMRICEELKLDPHVKVNQTTIRSIKTWLLHGEKSQTPPPTPYT